MGNILKKGFDLMEINLFGQTSDVEKILQKTILLLEMSHVQQNLAFLEFWSIFSKLTKKLLF